MFDNFVYAIPLIMITLMETKLLDKKNMLDTIISALKNYRA